MRAQGQGGSREWDSGRGARYLTCSGTPWVPLCAGLVTLALGCANGTSSRNPSLEGVSLGPESGAHTGSDAAVGPGVGALDGGQIDASVDAGPRDEWRACGRRKPPALPQRVVLMIADGYGAAQLEATRGFVNGNSEPLLVETLPYRADLSTDTVQHQITDSAASATAMATGRKVINAVISRANPGDHRDLMTALEYHKQRGHPTALITAHTFATDATPAAFGAHAANRYDDLEISAMYLQVTQPSILFGHASQGFSPENAKAAGYAVVTTESELSQLDPKAEPPVAGTFTAATAPHLSVMSRFALDRLASEKEGFFLLIEQEETDTSGHSNDLPGVLAAAVEFQEAVAEVVDWASARGDTLVVVGADHETGGLQLMEPEPIAGEIPAHMFTTGGHTSTAVPFFAMGPGGDRLEQAQDITDVFPLLAGLGAVEYSVHCEPDIAEDTRFDEFAPEEDFSDARVIALDSAPGHRSEGLIRFNTEFEELRGATVRLARLVLATTHSESPLAFHRILADWQPSNTWADVLGSQKPTRGIDALRDPDALLPGSGGGIAYVDVTSSVQAWVAEPGSNYGWLVVPSGPAEFQSLESTDPPRLIVYYE